MIKRANQKKKKGFSLIELIIVLAVMAIIALIAIPNFNAVKENAKVKSDVQSGNAISRSVETLLVDESVKGTGKITIDFGKADEEKVSAEVGTGKLEVDTKVFASEEALETYIKEIVTEKPQEKGKNGYEISISEGKVTTKTIEGTSDSK